MRVKLGKEHEDFKILNEWWDLFQKYYEIDEDKSKQAEEVIKDCEELCERHNNSVVAIKLSTALLGILEERGLK